MFAPTTDTLKPSEKQMGLLEDATAYVLGGTREKATRGKNRALILSLREEIDRAIGGGISIKVCWEVLKAQGKVDMTYESFRQYVNREVLKRKDKGRITPRSEANSVPSPAAGAGNVGAGQEARPTSPSGSVQDELPATKGPARISAATSSDKAFDFDPITRRKR